MGAAAAIASSSGRTGATLSGVSLAFSSMSAASSSSSPLLMLLLASESAVAAGSSGAAAAIASSSGRTGATKPCDKCIRAKSTTILEVKRKFVSSFFSFSPFISFVASFFKMYLSRVDGPTALPIATRAKPLVGLFFKAWAFGVAFALAGAVALASAATCCSSCRSLWLAACRKAIWV